MKTVGKAKENPEESGRGVGKEALSQRATVTGHWLLCQVLKVPQTVALRHKITITQLIAAFQ